MRLNILNKVFLVLSIIVFHCFLLGMEDSGLSSGVAADEILARRFELAQNLLRLQNGELPYTDIAGIISDLSRITISTSCDISGDARQVVQCIDRMTSHNMQGETVLPNQPLIVRGVVRIFLSRLRELGQDGIFYSKDVKVIDNFGKTQNLFRSLAQSMQLLKHYEVAGMLFLAADIFQQASKIMQQQITHSGENADRFLALLVRLDNFAFSLGINTEGWIMSTFIRMMELPKINQPSTEQAKPVKSKCVMQ